ncbi:hypothetical protein RB597_003789 [Gaeumannomyces tritici]
MGILTCLDSRPRLAFPGTPPELVSPSSSTYSSRPSEAALPSPPPMSSYEQPTAELLRGKSPEDSRQSPREQQQRQQQQQQQLPQPPQQQQQPQQQERQVLPPLSSILTLTQDGRPLHSPVSEGRRAYSATASPLDRPHTSSASSSSYFPSSAATAAAAAAAAAPLPRLRAGPFEPRLDERPSLFQPLSRDPFPRPPLSPQSRDGEPTHQQQQQQQQQYRPSSAADRGSDYGPPPPLPALHQRGEYSPHSGRAQLERYPAPLTGVKREADQMSGHHHHHHHYQQQQHTQQLQRAPSIHHHHHHAAPPPPPPTPPAGAMVVVVASSSSSSSSSSEGGMPSKDGLGPKIWTGTHFLPRFVRAAEVPGEGTCYFYDDGSHCKAVIDGEQVNAHWGVTKAGKPRKRLAIACITCREKKIKCDPDYPRCVQCEKFGRVCKFKNAPRGGNNTSPSTPPAEMDESRRLGGSMVRPPPVMDGPRPGSNSSASVSPRTVLRPASPDMMNPAPAKRPRLGGFGDHGYSHHSHQQQQPQAPPSYSHYTHAPQQHPPSPYSHHPYPPPPQQQQQQHQAERRRSPVMLPLPLPVPQLQRDPRDGGGAKPDWHHRQHQQRHDLPRIHDDPRRGWQTDSYESRRLDARA